MPYAPDLNGRFSWKVNDLFRRVTKLESRTAGIDSGAPLAVLPAKIDPAYSGTGDPKVLINGSTTLTGPCQHLTSYTPVAGDQVLVIPTPATAPGLTSYVVLGKFA